MPTYNLPSESSVNVTKGLDSLVGYVATEVDIFTPMLLFTFFMIVFLGGMYKQKKDEARMEAAPWFAIAGFLTFGLALIMAMTTDWITIRTLVITLSVSIAGAVWYLTTKDYGFI